MLPCYYNTLLIRVLRKAAKLYPREPEYRLPASNEEVHLATPTAFRRTCVISNRVASSERSGFSRRKQSLLLLRNLFRIGETQLGGTASSLPVFLQAASTVIVGQPFSQGNLSD